MIGRSVWDGVLVEGLGLPPVLETRDDRANESTLDTVRSSVSASVSFNIREVFEDSSGGSK